MKKSLKSAKATADISWGMIETSFGWCAAAWSPKGVLAFILPKKTRKSALQELKRIFPLVRLNCFGNKESKITSDFQGKLSAALVGKAFRPIPLDTRLSTPFQRKILNATRLVKKGQTRSYAWVAQKAGSPRGCRAAGQALNRNPIPLFIPCHRIVASNRNLGGFGSGIQWKIKLLKAEGVPIETPGEDSYRVGKV